MTPERWRQAEEIFQAALDRDASSRASFLDAACAGDAELRRDVESLLSAHHADDRLLESSALEHAARDLAGEMPRLSPGQRLGAYVLTLLSPQRAGWQVVENISLNTPRGTFTVDFALVAPVNPMGQATTGNPHHLLDLPPNQPSGRGNGTPFCVAGPFPPRFSIEQIIDGVVVRFHRVQPHGPSTDLGLWDRAARTVPLHP